MRTRRVLAWSVIGVFGAVCIIVGVRELAASGTATFEALKFAGAGVILLVIAIDRIAGRHRRR